MDRTEHLTENEVALYVDGLKLHQMEAVPGELLSHVQECFECKRAVMEISAAIPASAYSEGASHPYFGTGPAVRRAGKSTHLYVRVAAGIVLLLGVGTTIFYVVSHKEAGPKEATAVQANEHGRPAPAGDLKGLAEAAPQAATGSFKPSVLYDRLASEKFRSVGSMSHHPANGDTVTAPELFTWNGTKGAGPYTLTVLDNRGGESVQADLNEGSYRLEKKLKPGLYYWKVEEGGELVFVGKFYVVR